MNGVTVITHPLVQHNLTRLRDKRTQPQEFRRLLGEIAALMLYEATRSFAVKKISVETPLAAANGFQLEREVGSRSGSPRRIGNVGFHLATHSARARRFHWIEARGNDLARDVLSQKFAEKSGTL